MHYIYSYSLNSLFLSPATPSRCQSQRPRSMSRCLVGWFGPLLKPRMERQAPEWDFTASLYLQPNWVGDIITVTPHKRRGAPNHGQLDCSFNSLSRLISKQLESHHSEVNALPRLQQSLIQKHLCGILHHFAHTDRKIWNWYKETKYRVTEYYLRYCDGFKRRCMTHLQLP